MSVVLSFKHQQNYRFCHCSSFLIFLDCEIEFSVKSCVHSQLEISVEQNCSQQIRTNNSSRMMSLYFDPLNALKRPYIPH